MYLQKLILTYFIPFMRAKYLRYTQTMKLSVALEDRFDSRYTGYFFSAMLREPFLSRLIA
jgi:hypothetical protein